MRVGDLGAEHYGKMVSFEDRSGVLRHVGRRAVTVDDVWITVHVEVFGGNSVLFMREHEPVLVEA